MSGDESIIVTIAPFDRGPESDRGGGRCPRTQFWRGVRTLSLVVALQTMMYDVVVASDKIKYNRILSLTAIRVQAGMQNSRPVGFLR